ncbi:hypothetical protein ACVXZ4_04095 [Lacisediminihabitans sp. FW035]
MKQKITPRDTELSATSAETVEIPRTNRPTFRRGIIAAVIAVALVAAGAGSAFGAIAVVNEKSAVVYDLCTDPNSSDVVAIHTEDVSIDSAAAANFRVVYSLTGCQVSVSVVSWDADGNPISTPISRALVTDLSSGTVDVFAEQDYKFDASKPRVGDPHRGWIFGADAGHIYSVAFEMTDANGHAVTVTEQLTVDNDPQRGIQMWIN